MLIRMVIPPALILISITVLVLSFYIEEQSVMDPSSAAFFPALLGGIMTVCAILIAIRGILPLSSAEKATEDSEEESTVEMEEISKKDLNIRIFSFLLLVGLFAFLMNYLNFLIISFLFLFSAMFLLSKQKILTSLLIASIFSGVFYYLFVHVFHIVFPV